MRFALSFIRIRSIGRKWLVRKWHACIERWAGALIKVHHIGSTSIPGIMAKPIIDLIPVVSNLGSLDRDMPLLEECLGEFGIAGRRYCRRSDPATGKRAYHLHCYAEQPFEPKDIDGHHRRRDSRHF